MNSKLAISRIPRTPIRLAGLLSFSLCAWAQIGLVHVTSCGGQVPFPATTCPIPATSSGNLLVVGWASTGGGGATTIASITDNAGNSYLEAGAARAVDSNMNDMGDIWYAKNSVPGATVITILPNPSGASGTAVIWEFSGLDPNAPLSQTAVLNSQPATTTPSGAPVARPFSTSWWFQLGGCRALWLAFCLEMSFPMIPRQPVMAGHTMWLRPQAVTAPSGVPILGPMAPAQCPSKVSLPSQLTQPLPVRAI